MDANIKFNHSTENIDTKVKTSPFSYFHGMKYELTKKRDCTIRDIHNLIKKGIFTDKHYAIIRVLYDYTYLNAFLIREAVAIETDNKIILTAASCRQILKSLVNEGVLLQYSFSHIDAEGKLKGSPFIYKLSPGGIRYMKGHSLNKNKILKLFDTIKKEDERPFSIVPTLNLLTMNQFHIMFMKSFRNKPYLYDVKYYKVFEIRKKPIVFPGVYELKMPQFGCTLTLFVYSIRTNDGWAREHLDMLRKIKDCTEYYNMSGIGVLVVCETEYQAMRAQRYKSCEAELKDLDVFYICDTSMVENENILSQLIEVLPDDNYTTRRIFGINFVDQEPNKDESNPGKI